MKTRMNGNQQAWFIRGCPIKEHGLPPVKEDIDTGFGPYLLTLVDQGYVGSSFNKRGGVAHRTFDQHLNQTYRSNFLKTRPDSYPKLYKALDELHKVSPKINFQPIKIAYDGSRKWSGAMVVMVEGLIILRGGFYKSDRLDQCVRRVGLPLPLRQIGLNCNVPVGRRQNSEELAANALKSIELQKIRNSNGLSDLDNWRLRESAAVAKAEVEARNKTAERHDNDKVRVLEEFKRGKEATAFFQLVNSSDANRRAKVFFEIANGPHRYSFLPPGGTTETDLLSFAIRIERETPNGMVFKLWNRTASASKTAIETAREVLAVNGGQRLHSIDDQAKLEREAVVTVSRT
ncbi:hypothetical protein HDU76_003251, partial [Blyttiomyces sp. JEL0837]